MSHTANITNYGRAWIGNETNCKALPEAISSRQGGPAPVEFFYDSLDGGFAGLA